MKKKWMSSLLALLMLCMTLFGGCGAEEIQGTDEAQTEVYTYEDEEEAYENEVSYEDEEAYDEAEATLDEDGWYSAPEDVALYIHTYGELPDNFITKKEAQELGWDSKKGNLWEVADGMSIGGDYFGNREGLLPEEDEYTECDVNYTGGFRGSERIVFSDDGDIYYTGDHYESFEQLY